MYKRFTLKTIRETFKRGVYQPELYMIRLDNKDCGVIRKEEDHWIIKLMVSVSETDSVSWIWIQLEETFISKDSAFVYLNENAEEITSKYKFYTKG